MRTSVALRFIFILGMIEHVHGSPFTVDSALTYKGEENCLQTKCIQKHQRLTCDGCIPVTVPHTVNAIILNSLYGHHLIAQGFCKVSWTNVKSLSIINDMEDLSAKYIVDYAFDCLHRIENLKLSIVELTNLTANTLHGLQSLKCLDFTDSSSLEIPALITAFSINTVVPKLNKLILSNVGSIYSGVTLTQEFIDSLAIRNITELNLSLAYVLFEDIPFGRLCDTLKILNVSKARIIYSSSLPLIVCKALEIVDFSGAKLPQSKLLPINITMNDNVIRFHKIHFKFFSHASAIYMNNMVPVEHYIYLQNMTFIFAVNNSIAELHLAGYNIPVFELEIIFRPNHLLYIDISNNRIERIGTNTFRSLTYLTQIDLSYNKLGRASKDTLDALFRNNAVLASLNLAYCELTSLPQNVFDFNTQLEHLELRGNRLTQIDFEISSHKYLMSLDLRDNLIEYLDASSRQQLDNLGDNKQSFNDMSERNKSIAVDMRNNPFSCQCNSLEFIVWFVNSPIFKDSRDEYYCKIGEKHIPMNDNAVTAAKYDCDKPARKLRKVLICSLVPCITFIIAIVVSLHLFKRYRSLKHRQRLRVNIAQIIEETLEFRFPVFLSYASADSEFVAEHVHQPLKAHLNALTGAERDLVAIGDRYFRLGRSIFAEIIRLLEDCAVVVIVLSTNYCNSEYCKHEIEQARLMRKPIVVIMKEFVNESEMNVVIKETYKYFTRATFRFGEDGFRFEHDWDYVCESIIQLL